MQTVPYRYFDKDKLTKMCERKWPEGGWNFNASKLQHLRPNLHGSHVLQCRGTTWYLDIPYDLTEVRTTHYEVVCGETDVPTVGRTRGVPNQKNYEKITPSKSPLRLARAMVYSVGTNSSNESLHPAFASQKHFTTYHLLACSSSLLFACQ